eukprot:CAMPEP_0171886604 /NCGR_PEP_ID=MMETSP0992-20121227/41985_1 /TAXON_ID=483369 /ORGANISM="non described non described, Strain CCMP2098" /LENGTH=50 /DNA_ID=CAMNT_0012513265 /DNA_START=417 /DNA_END=565 /DNA_ORIENTATION=-
MGTRLGSPGAGSRPAGSACTGTCLFLPGGLRAPSRVLYHLREPQLQPQPT